MRTLTLFLFTAVLTQTLPQAHAESSDLLLSLSEKWNKASYDSLRGNLILENGKDGASALHATYEPPKDRLHILETKDHVIAGSLVKMIDAVPRGSWIRLTYYRFTNKVISSALVRAIHRGVVVRIVASNFHGAQAEGSGEDTEEPASNNALEVANDLKAAIASFPDPNHLFVTCTKGNTSGACIGTGKNHNKFFLFSQICRSGVDPTSGKCVAVRGNASYPLVAAQTSINLTYDQLKQFNTLTVFFGNADIYTAYRRYFNSLAELSALPPSGDFRFQKNIAMPDGSTMEFNGLPRPEATASSDIMLQPLKTVKCANPREKRTIVRVSNAHWTKARTTEAAGIFKALAQNGCEIRIYGSRGLSDHVTKFTDESGTAHAIKPEYSAAYSVLTSDFGLPVKSFTSDANYKGNNHSKFIVVEHPLGKGNILMIGSMSFTAASQPNNDETWVVWNNASKEAVNFYRDAFDRQWK